MRDLRIGDLIQLVSDTDLDLYTSLPEDVDTLADVGLNVWKSQALAVLLDRNDDDLYLMTTTGSGWLMSEFVNGVLSHLVVIKKCSNNEYLEHE